MDDGTDFSGATLRDCLLRGTRLANAWVEDVSITGVVLGLVVNGVRGFDLNRIHINDVVAP